MAHEIKYCRKCGAQIDKEARFCPNCGCQFIAKPQQPVQQTKERAQKKPAPAGKKRLKGIFILTAVILIFFYVVGSL